MPSVKAFRLLVSSLPSYLPLVSLLPFRGLWLSPSRKLVFHPLKSVINPLQILFMSNCQTWAETFAPIEAKNRDVVYTNTWGHLAPEKNVTYRSKVLFCISEYGDTVLIKDGMPNSPWMYEALYTFINTFEGLEVGVYEINTTVRNYRFWGKPNKIL